MKNVHTEHCCVNHGCKYGDIDCPVWLALQPQSFPCEECNNVAPITPSEDVLTKRRNKAQESYPIIDED